MSKTFGASDCGKCKFCGKALNQGTANCPLSSSCSDCWRKNREKMNEGIRFFNCPKCQEWYELEEPLPNTLTCRFCGTTWELETYEIVGEHDRS